MYERFSFWEASEALLVLFARALFAACFCRAFFFARSGLKALVPRAGISRLRYGALVQISREESDADALNNHIMLFFLEFSFVN